MSPSYSTLHAVADGLDTSWKAHGACYGAASEDGAGDLFYPQGTTGPAAVQIEANKAVCSTCPARAACLDYALATNQTYGIWGGTTEGERRRLRRHWLAEHRPNTVSLVCPSGHTLAGENLGVGAKGAGYCVICKKATNARTHAREQAAKSRVEVEGDAIETAVEAAVARVFAPAEDPSGLPVATGALSSRSARPPRAAPKNRTRPTSGEAA